MNCWHLADSLIALILFILFSRQYLGYNPALIPLQPNTASIHTNLSSTPTMSGMKSVAYFVNWVSLSILNDPSLFLSTSSTTSLLVANGEPQGDLRTQP